MKTDTIGKMFVNITVRKNKKGFSCFGKIFVMPENLKGNRLSSQNVFFFQTESFIKIGEGTF